MYRKTPLLILCFSLFAALPLRGQTGQTEQSEQTTVPLGELSEFWPIVETLRGFSERVPREKVYLHFDNTSYREGDNVYFKCYVSAPGSGRPSTLSRTLYVELLNPGGEVVGRRILRIEGGQCHGEFTLNHTPFYSGFYEVRAYTEYMLNFGEEAIFSRLLPVYDPPRREGDFEEKEMMSYNVVAADNRPVKRPRPVREDRAVNVRFYPEGGNLVAGVPSRVAFEATDRTGNPIEITGTVAGGTVFASSHEGRGIFVHTPGAEQVAVVEVEHEGRRFRFSLPEALPQGVTMEVDNLSEADSMAITLRKGASTPVSTFGVAVLSGGRLQNILFVRVGEEAVAFKTPKTDLPAGVSRIVLFNVDGAIVGDRLVFIPASRERRLDIRATTDKPLYAPHEAIGIDFSVVDGNAAPVSGVTFSVAVRDGTDAVEYRGNIMTDLLLSSEIRGYVRDPLYYFEGDDPARRSALDNLLMVQGWRRYSWEQMAGLEPFELRYPHEQAIDTRGRIITINRFNGRETPQDGVDVSLMLTKTDTASPEGARSDSLAMESFVTDELGRFSFSSDVEGRWNMIIGAEKNGRNRDYLIMLDRLLSPPPRRYDYTDLQATISSGETLEEQAAVMEVAPQDSVRLSPDTATTAPDVGVGVDKVNAIEQVTVRARARDRLIRHHRSTSVAYYDAQAEFDDYYDETSGLAADIHDMLKATNENFTTVNLLAPLSGGMPNFSPEEYKGPTSFMSVPAELSGNTDPESMESHEFLLYRGKLAAVIVDYKRVEWNTRDFFEYKRLTPEAIKSVWVNERVMEVVPPYVNIPPLHKTMGFIYGTFGCVVFIETWPEGEINVSGGRGTRKTYLEGYSTAGKFYSPDYSAVPPADPDYRRTLYWNPNVTTGATGRAGVRFYNNSRSRRPVISAETLTPSGAIGISR
jgi:hypothetical protein